MVVLTDQYGVPMPNVDQRRTDIHGRELQPESDEAMPYLPRGPDQGEEVAREHALHTQMRLQRAPLAQHQVDPIRYRGTINLARSAIRQNWPQRQPLRHVWFPTPGDLDTYEMRTGNAPAVTDRPKHLRRVKLSIDINDITPMWRAALRPEGLLEQMVRQAVHEAGKDGLIAHGALLQDVIQRMYHTHPWPGIND